MTTLLPIPRRCIWCKRTEPEAAFTSESHVLANAVGNVLQALPPGIVCDQCNQYYGSKIEPWLLDDPLFHARAVVVGLVDPEDMNAFRGKMFDERHPPVGQVIRKLHLDIGLSGQRLTLGVDYAIKGTMLREYEDRKSTRLNSSHSQISYAVFCLKKKRYSKCCC